MTMTEAVPSANIAALELELRQAHERILELVREMQALQEKQQEPQS